MHDPLCATPWTTEAPPTGWYADPDAQYMPGTGRFWTGEEWSDMTIKVEIWFTPRPHRLRRSARSGRFRGTRRPCETGVMRNRRRRGGGAPARRLSSIMEARPRPRGR
ncbi:DUF2510 domain-containing protein [Kribbella solani]|uniref:DUF2510 domain-containing protein n=1 Tax=Kribbella solani TaxID=236067 RepID=UPI003CD0893E